MTSDVETITNVNLNDLVSAFGWQSQPLLAAVLRRLFTRPAHMLARQMVDFDNDVGNIGLVAASRKFLRTHFVRDVLVFGREHLSPTGPVLILSNHPGIADTLSLFVSINRPDLTIIALKNPFLAALENISRSLQYVGIGAAESARTVRQVAAHLRGGHAALTFPAGRIEPDLEVYEGALDSLDNWADSAGAFVRLAPDTEIVPVLVSGVIWEKAARHWIASVRRTREERERFAAAWQLLAMVTQNLRPTTVKVRFAEPITRAEISALDTGKIHHVIVQRMRALMQTSSASMGESVL